MNSKPEQTKKAKSSSLTVIAGLAVFSSLAFSGCADMSPPRLDLPTVDLSLESSPSPSSSPFDPGTLSDAFAELELEDQSGDGSKVQIEEIRISFETGFIGIFDVEGNLLGSAKVTNQSQPVSVKLDTSLGNSTKLLGKLYADNGDGVFDPASDMPVLDDDREMVIEDFDYQLSN